MSRTSVLVMALAACSGGEDPPTCQQAVTHYYEAGCSLFDLQTGAPIAAGVVVSQCQSVLAAAPDRCLGELDDLRSCWGSVRAPALTNADCDCSAEQEALLTCE